MDFVTDLPQSRNQCDLIWVIVDRMTKSTHFLPVRTGYSAEDYAKLYLAEIVKLHGAPISIIFYGTPFSLYFWKSFHKGLGNNVCLNTAFHPQLDGQAKRTIQTLEAMFRG